MPSILIVDDDPNNLDSLKQELEDSNPTWIVLTAQSEREAKSVLSECSIDVVISDLVMATDQSGMDVLRQAKEKDSLIMVILITAFEKKLDRYCAFELTLFTHHSRLIAPRKPRQKAFGPEI